MNGRSKSILLQVAFKGAIEMGEPDPDTITGYYEILLALHDRLGIDSDDGGPKRGGGGSGWSGGAQRQPTALPSETSVFTARSTQIVDYRAAKTAGSVKPNFPDFKTLDGSKIFNGRDGVWMIGQDGSANAEVADLVEAAKEGAIF